MLSAISNIDGWDKTMTQGAEPRYTQGWVTPPAQMDGPAKAAPILGGVSLALTVIPGIGWLADIVFGPVAFGVCLAALVRALRRHADRTRSLVGLLLSLPGFAWACYALIGILVEKA
jgi:hypothetical protein